MLLAGPSIVIKPIHHSTQLELNFFCLIQKKFPNQKSTS
jgi:hypothetical protein